MPEQAIKAFGEAIRQARSEMRLSQQDLVRRHILLQKKCPVLDCLTAALLMRRPERNARTLKVLVKIASNPYRTKTRQE